MSEPVICPCCGERDWICEDAMFGSYEPPKTWWVFSNGRAIYSEPTEEQARASAETWRSEMVKLGKPEPRIQLEHAVYPPADPNGHGWIPSSAAIPI